MSPYESSFRRLSTPLDPVPTGVAPQLPLLPDIRAVMWDIYGTLIISGCGDIGTTGDSPRSAALSEALAELGFTLHSPAAEVVDLYLNTIAQQQAKGRESGIVHAEVNILEVWSDVFDRLIECGGIDQTAAPPEIAKLAVEFEARANPTWPMPGVREVLKELCEREFILGIISNAQVFTAELFPALVDESLDDLGFDPQLRYYSYEHRHAKPSDYMYRLAAECLASRGIGPAEVLYVGNDMRNDVMPAQAVGFRTALFAGDARSWRPRDGDPSVVGVRPDALVTDLAQIPQLLLAQSN